MAPIMSDPWHFAIWLTGAAVWTVVLIALAALVAAVTWQAIFATAEVARGFWRIYSLGLKRNKDCTIAEAWLYAFWHGGLMK
jgi:hypothetical protein